MKGALDTFEEQISFPEEEVRGKAYKILLHAYKESLEPVWNLAHFADVGIVLKTISDKEMLELRTMAKKLQPAPTTSKVTKETRPIPGLESILDALKDKYPSEIHPLRTQSVCRSGRRSCRTVNRSHPSAIHYVTNSSSNAHYTDHCSWPTSFTTHSTATPTASGIDSAG